MTAARLNVFQRLARGWDAVHPYNAAQVLCIRGRADAGPLGRAWAETVAAHGIGVPRVAGRWYRLDGAAPAPPAVEVLNADAPLARHLSNDLNRPFGTHEIPFRAFLLQGDLSYLGLVYEHWTADSVSVRRLMEDWFCRFYDPAAVRAEPLRPCRLGYRDLFGASHPDWRAASAVASLLRRYLALRRVRKVHTYGPRDHRVRVRLLGAPPGLAEALRCRARAWNVTVNDVFVAALAETAAKLVPSQRRPGRRGLAVASVVDLRPHATVDLSGAFGLFLGFTTTVCKGHDLADWGRLLNAVAAQSRVSRRDGVGPASALWLAAAEVGSRFVPPQRVYGFHRKELPLAAGISNVNLNGSWAARYHPTAIVDYLRVSPTGPVAPAVLAVTTLGERMHLALTYRANLLNEWTAIELLRAFVARLRAAAAA